MKQAEFDLDDPRVEPTPVEERVPLTLCWACNGTGRGRYLGEFWTWVWHRPRIYSDFKTRLGERVLVERCLMVSELVCSICGGSGLNVSASRAWELEKGCRRDMTR